MVTIYNTIARFHRTLENIIQLLWAEYRREHVVMMYAHTPKFMLLLFCTTFIFSTSVRELLVERTPGFTPRICGIDFREYGGKCKAIWTGNDPAHYRTVLKNAETPQILREYSSNLSIAINRLESTPIMARSGKKSIYFVENGSRRLISNYDVFNRLQLNEKKIR